LIWGQQQTLNYVILAACEAIGFQTVPIVQQQLNGRQQQRQQQQQKAHSLHHRPSLP